ncbi:thioredoxin [Clostridium sp. MCC353]|uniref:thioredoxin n=1 Tax=Clostridium sp. MCC353 TaxID=2592646 RepID=UPI001C036C65|nr:thioredoxin [Clostridium sp. MCC353]MBT9777426.1 thioredoxin [Clostridium sp. MCC353]
MAILKITKENFDSEVMNSDKPVMVDFFATWCGPCKMLHPVVEALSNEVTDVKIGELDIDEEIELAERFRIMTVPSLVLFKNGEAVDKLVGVQSKGKVLEFIRQ